MPSPSEVIKEILSRKTPVIRTKKEFYELYDLGFFGNKAKTWTKFEDFEKDGKHKKVNIRVKTPGIGSRSLYSLELQDIVPAITKLKEEGYPEHQIVFNQCMPDEKLLIQGEVMRTSQGYSLYYTLAKKPMNLGFEEDRNHAQGLSVLMILKHLLSPPSFADLESLFELFPDSIVEFSCYSVPVGNIPGRNTVIWEVRNY